jgi:two-component system chemotaxis response regulator CheB
MKTIKALIADDSVVYRTQIRTALSAYGWIEVVGAASNGRLALERLKQTPIDLLILDLEMPEMDGLQTLIGISKIGVSVHTLVFSSVSKRGAEITFEALRMGAKDFVTKPGHTEGTDDPAAKIRSLLEPKLQALFPEYFKSKENLPVSTIPNQNQPSYPKILWELFKPKVVVIGSSTGGPTALEKLFLQLSRPLTVPVLVAQHMPPVFTAGLAERISRLCGIRAKEGQQGEAIESGCIYIAPGDYHMTIGGSSLMPTIKLDRSPLINSVRPAVDPLFESAAKIYREKCLGVVLTGMGQDGKVGAQAIKTMNGAVIIQNRESSVVFGMPGAVHEIGAFDKIGNIDKIAALLDEKISERHQLGEIKNA